MEISKKYQKMVLILVSILLLTGCSKKTETSLLSVKISEEYINTVNTSNLITKLKDQHDDLEKYNIILIGEGHGTVGNFVLELELIKYFHESQNIQNIIYELGYGTGAMINKYIQTGDTSVLENILKSLKNTTACTNEFKSFLVSLYEFNQSLTKGNRLNLHGVDVEHQYENGLMYLLSLRTKKPLPQEIATTFENLSESHSNKSIDKVLESVEKYPMIYKDYFGENYSEFLKTLKSMNQGILYYEKRQDENYREECLVENTITEIERTNDKYIGIYGYKHVNLLKANHAYTTVGRELIEKYGRGLGGVVSIVFEYDNSFYMNAYGKSKPIAKSRSINYIEDEEGDFFLIPLREDDKSIIKREFSKEHQYVIIIKNSPAATLLEFNN